MKSINTYRATDKQLVEHLIIPVIFEGLLRQQLKGKEHTIAEAKKIYTGFRQEIDSSLSELHGKRKLTIQNRLIRLSASIYQKAYF